MVSDEIGPTRRRVLLGAAGAGAAASAGCIDLGSSGGDGPSHLGVCDINVASNVDESAGETPVRIEVQRDGELAHEETYRLATSRVVRLQEDEHDWLGDDVPYRITVAPETGADPFVYDTGEDGPANGCRGFFAIFGGDEITGGPVYRSSVED